MEASNSKSWARPDEVDSFIREITVESPVARNIKNHYVDKIPLMKNCTGFRIER